AHLSSMLIAAYSTCSFISPFFFLLLRPPPCSTLFPYTTLFRSLPWPFPRALHGKLLDVISGGRPLAIGVDLLFPEPSARGPNDDAALGAAVARAKNVVLAAARAETVEYIGNLASKKTGSDMPLAIIRRGAAAVAPINMYPDID